MLPASGPIFCVGEALWDSLPEGMFLGGAPLNVACHLRKLGEDARLVSRVGADRLGSEILRRAQAAGLPTDGIQIDPRLETGLVTVEIGEAGEPAYTFNTPCAWDRIATDASMIDAAPATLVFGSLAQRLDDASRRSIAGLCALPDMFGVFDLNFREPYVDRGAVEHSLQCARMAKMNAGELRTLAGWAGVAQPARRECMRGVATAYELEVLVATFGGEGAAMCMGEQFHEIPGRAVRVQDTVGAGDAFLAGLLHKLRRGAAPQDALAFANRLGALVASRRGAVPDYDLAELEKF